jgi:hypothetical protein
VEEFPEKASEESVGIYRKFGTGMRKKHRQGGYWTLWNEK